MTAVHRLQVLEQQAGQILRNMGYEPLIMGDLGSGRHNPFNLIARKEFDDGTFDGVMVKLKICLHPIASLTEAAVFCRDEIRCVKKFFDQVPAEVIPPRFEVWVSIPSNKFQQFEITRDDIREIFAPEDKAGREAGAA